MSGVSYGLHIRVLGSKNEKVGLLLVLGFGAIRLRYGRFRSVLKLTKTNNMNKQRQRFLPAVVCSINMCFFNLAHYFIIPFISFLNRLMDFCC